MEIQQVTRYPWDGHIILTVTTPEPLAMTLALRWPAWAETMDLRVNGQTPDGAKGGPGQYVTIERTWQTGDKVELTFPMHVHHMAADPRVQANAGKIALMRGPVVFCFEQVDQPEVDLSRIAIPAGASFTAKHKPDLLGGVTVLTGEAVSAFADPSLYEPVGAIGSLQTVRVTAIPYFAWANREAGPMKVWVARL